MANSSARARFYNVAELGLHAGNATTGVWATALASNKYTLRKAAAATTSVVNIPVPKAQQGQYEEDARVATIRIDYTVSTAALSSAPTVILNNLKFDSTNGDLERTAVTQTVTFGGLDAVGTAVGDHFALVTVTTPTALTEDESLVVSITMNEAATSVLDLNGIKVTYT